MAGPFESVESLGAVRFSSDSKKLVVKSMFGKRLEIWDVHTQKLDAIVAKSHRGVTVTSAPVFWTAVDKTIIAAFSFIYSDLMIIRHAREAQPNIKHLATRAAPCAVTPSKLPFASCQISAYNRPTATHFKFPSLPSRTSSSDAVRPILNDEPGGPLESPATSPLHPNRFPSAQATTKSPPSTIQRCCHYLQIDQTSWWSIRAGHTLLPIVDVPLAPGKVRIVTAGAPVKDDDDLIRDEDYVSPPPSLTPGLQSPSAARPINVISGEHGSGCLCFCF
ncbi:hypothetical protein BDR05DRAFT_999836 [Suillus weaverae]|nr:hypothetical protein BDR05DRAFT_999836 [Suillus weaverae]